MLELSDKYFKAAIIKMLELAIRKCLKQMKTIESPREEMETLSTDTEDIYKKKNPMDILELKIILKN